MLGSYAEQVAQEGPEAFALMEHVGIPASALADPDMLISWSAVGNLMEALAARLHKPCLGLEWASAPADPFLNFGPLALLAQFPGTLGAWCSALRDYWRYHTNALRVELLEPPSGEDVVLRFTTDEMVPPSRHQIEFTIGGTCRMVRALADFADSDFTLVRFQHLEPPDKSCHARLFRCPVEFGAPHNEFVFRRALHDLKIHPPAGHLERYIAARSGTVPGFDGSTRARVEATVPCFVGTRYCTLAHVAALFSMGPKKLQRALARQGTNFAEVVDQARERVARRLLVETDVPVTSIAGLLGYATTPPFTVAFRRWAGVSPREYRKARAWSDPSCASVPSAERAEA